MWFLFTEESLGKYLLSEEGGNAGPRLWGSGRGGAVEGPCN